ncbi:MAG: hypothetical protein HY921_09930 [Elusimicrobia bacterium]|nr:hypothetical protein [Elusimicrobiota bacterium]
MNLLFLLSAAVAHAQTPAARPEKPERAALHSVGPDQQAPPLALALDMAFGPAVWAEVKISTTGPVAELSGLVKEGYYKLEIIQLVLMSVQARRPLKEAVKKRSDGAKLSDIAAGYKLDYDKLYDSALAVEALVDKEYLPRFPEPKPRISGRER